MKLSKGILLFVFMLTIAAVHPATAADKVPTKIGFVDLSRLFDEYHKTQSVDQLLETKHNGFESIRNEKIEKIKEAQGKLGLLTEDKKASLEEEIEGMKADLLEFDRQQKTDLTKERNEKIREILLEIEKVVSDYAEKEKYSVILNDRVLIYGNESYDVTEPVLEILNSTKK